LISIPLRRRNNSNARQGQISRGQNPKGLAIADGWSAIRGKLKITQNIEGGNNQAV